MQMVLPFDYGRGLNGVKRQCIVDQCAADVYGHGYCSKHYYRWKRNGDPYTVRKSANGTHIGKTCPVEGCSEPMRLLGYCNTHGLRYKRYGDVHALQKVRSYSESDECLAKSCSLRPRINGYCTTHWARVKSNGSSEVVRKPSSWAGVRCSEPDCDEQAQSKGWCRPHYIQNNMANFVGYTRKRRAIKRAAQVIDYQAQQVVDRMAYWGNKCWMCGGSFESVDHVKPLSKGGADCPANFRPACKSCNSSKKDRWYGVTELHRFIKS